MFVALKQPEKKNKKKKTNKSTNKQKKKKQDIFTVFIDFGCVFVFKKNLTFTLYSLYRFGLDRVICKISVKLSHTNGTVYLSCNYILSL